MSQKKDRTLPLRCRKCKKPLGMTLLIPARPNERAIDEMLRIATYSLCEDCKKSSISTITDPISNLLLRVKKMEM